MIQKKKTVFILGAGASNPYGYPTGDKLKEEIIALRSEPNFLTPTSSTCDYFNETEEFQDFGVTDSNHNPFEDLAEMFENSGQFSIDQFLRTQKKYIPIGKFAITYVLLNSEKRENLVRGGWCQKLWSRLSAGKDTPNEIEPNIGFVTFNYDTSLEYIISKAIKSTYAGAQINEVNNIFIKMPILHVHGMIKTLPWEREENSTLEKLGKTDLNDTEIIQMSKGIRLFHETNEDNVLNKAKELLAVADNIIFLGFGFDPVNISKLNHLIPRKFKGRQQPYNLRSRLGLDIRTPIREPDQIREVSAFYGKKIFATGLGLNPTQKGNVKKFDGLSGLKFVDYDSIYDFLNAHIDEFL